MSSSIPAVLVASDNGRISSQNNPARYLFGNKQDSYCWDVLCSLKHTENLPCRKNCVIRLLKAGFNRSLHADIKLEGKRHSLSCVPLDGKVVCTLRSEAAEPGEIWQSLTAREYDVIQRLAEGDTNGAIAVALGISESTVRTHIEKMLAKLGARNRAGLVASGFRLGYLN